MGHAILIIALCSVAQGTDPIKDTLDKAKQTFQKDDEAIRDAILKKFDEADEKATRLGDTKLSILVENETQAFREDKPCEFKSIDVADLKRQRATVLTKMKTAYEQAAKGYTMKRMKAEARAVQGELDSFELKEKENFVIPSKSATDLLKNGSTWTGKRYTNANKSTVSFVLTINERRGNRFRGITVGNGTNKHLVEGTIKDGKIEWRILEVLGGQNPGQPHTGYIKDDTLHLKFNGVWNDDVIDGTSELKLQR